MSHSSVEPATHTIRVSSRPYAAPVRAASSPSGDVPMIRRAHDRSVWMIVDQDRVV